MRRTISRLAGPSAFTTASPAVSDFWASCVSTPAVPGPNVALSKAIKVSHNLQKISDELEASTDQKKSNNETSSSSSSAIVMTRNDALLHANITNRLSASPTQIGNDNLKKSSDASVTHLVLPEFIYRRKTREIANEADKIYNAYREYYNHIKFRNKWEEPVIPKEDEFAVELLREAADICARIRARLDEENPSTKLRQADGSAQVFFNSPDCAKLYQAATVEADANEKLSAEIGKSAKINREKASRLSHFHRREFIKNVVFATFKDAMGFVEGLTKSKLERYFADISDFGFNPSAHMQHLLLEMLASTEVARMSFDIADAHLYEHESYGIVSQNEKSNAAPASDEVGGKDKNEKDLGEEGCPDKEAALTLEPPSVSRRALESARQSRDNAHFCAEDSTEDKLWRDAIGKLYKAHDALLLALAERKKNAIRHVNVVSVDNHSEGQQ